MQVGKLVLTAAKCDHFSFKSSLQRRLVKGGYIQFDKLPFDTLFVIEMKEYATIKLGDTEINYGDHDNVKAIYPWY